MYWLMLQESFSPTLNFHRKVSSAQAADRDEAVEPNAANRMKQYEYRTRITSTLGGMKIPSTLTT
jgi:hypothetical protein